MIKIITTFTIFLQRTYFILFISFNLFKLNNVTNNIQLKLQRNEDFHHNIIRFYGITIIESGNDKIIYNNKYLINIKLFNTKN